MDTNYVDKSRLPSRHVTEGPERAPHRSCLYAMGPADTQIHQPLRRQATAVTKGAAAHRGAAAGEVSVNVSEDEFARRKTAWKPRETEYGSGAIWKYAQLVGPARYGALTNPGAKGEKECYADI
jgi:dihydroxyacid dehydratase/phosphogluconate dehydratase